MRIVAAFAAAMLLLWPSARPASAQTAEEQARLDWAVERGRLLFGLDRAAWVATDDFLERVRNPAGSGVRGYIVERDGEGFTVTFYGGPEAETAALYRGRVRDHRLVSRELFAEAERPPLTAVQQRLAAVRAMAPGLGRRPCGEAPFNTAIVPPDTADGPIDLYLLTPQVREGEYPLGGHYRFTIAADRSVLSSREFTRSCLTMGGDQAPPPGAQAAAMFVTHLLDPVPTEIHVFTSLTAQLPVGVGTSNPQRLWWVTGDGIELMTGDRRTGRR